MTQLIKKTENDFPTLISDFFDTGRLFPTNWFENEWSNLMPFNKKMLPANWMPSANVTENGKEYKIELAVPGMNKEDIQVYMEDDMLTISGKHKEEKKEEKEKFTRKEFHYGSFMRSFRIPLEVKEDAIKVKYENGLLKLIIPKVEITKAKPKKEIKIG